VNFTFICLHGLHKDNFTALGSPLAPSFLPRAMCGIDVALREVPHFSEPRLFESSSIVGVEKILLQLGGQHKKCQQL
jgi:hypothetical protein